jgi:hypothetical protein
VRLKLGACAPAMIPASTSAVAITVGVLMAISYITCRADLRVRPTRQS